MTTGRQTPLHSVASNYSRPLDVQREIPDGQLAVPAIYVRTARMRQMERDQLFRSFERCRFWSGLLVSEPNWLKFVAGALVPSIMAFRSSSFIGHDVIGATWPIRKIPQPRMSRRAFIEVPQEDVAIFLGISTERRQKIQAGSVSRGKKCEAGNRPQDCGSKCREAFGTCDFDDLRLNISPARRRLQADRHGQPSAGFRDHVRTDRHRRPRISRSHCRTCHSCQDTP